MKERLESVLEEKQRAGLDWTWRKWASEAGINPTHITTWRSRLKKNPNAGVELKTLEKLARAANVPLERLTGSPEPTDMPIGTFLMRLAEAPGLRAAIDADPGRWRTSTLIGLLSYSGIDFAPVGGWVKFLDRLEKRRDAAAEYGREMKKARAAK